MKSKYFYITLFFILGFHYSLYSQIYFSKRYDFLQNSTPSYSTDIIWNGTNYILLNESIHGIQEYRLFGFIVLDSIGNQISNEIIYEDSTSGFSIGYPGSFIKTLNNSGYSLVGFNYTYVPNGRRDRGMLWQFDNNLDTLWTKTYSDDLPYDTSFTFRNFRQLPDEGYIIVGSHDLVNGPMPVRINLHRVDSLGNLIWRKYYGSGNNKYYFPYDVSRTSDNGFMISAILSSLNGGSSTQEDDPILIKTDSLGNQQWLKHFGNPDCREEWAMIDLAQDGKIVCGTIYSDTCWSSNEHLSMINIIKISNTNVVIWDKKYGVRKRWLRLNKIRILENGDILATGSYDNVTDFTRNETSWIIKTDSAGNELWYREYMLLTATFSKNILYNVIPTPDNGYIACGTVLPQLPDTGTQDSWVLKVDSLGCESPGNCWVGLDEIWVKNFTPGKLFVVYPNPASDKITVEFHTNPNGAEIELLTLSSQSIMQAHLSPMAESIELDVGDLKRGMYLLMIRIPERRPVVEKIILR